LITSSNLKMNSKRRSQESTDLNLQRPTKLLKNVRLNRAMRDLISRSAKLNSVTLLNSSPISRSVLTMKTEPLEKRMKSSEANTVLRKMIESYWSNN